MALVTTTRPILAPDLPFDVKTPSLLWSLPLGRSNVCRVFRTWRIGLFTSSFLARVCVSIFSAVFFSSDDIRKNSG